MLTEGPLCCRGFELKIQRIQRFLSKFKACCSNEMSIELLDRGSQSGRQCPKKAESSRG